MADTDEFTADEETYFAEVLADEDAQKTYARFEKWKAKKQPKPVTPAAPLTSSETPPPPPTPEKDWTLNDLEKLAARKPARSILRNLLDAADASEKQAMEALQSGEDALLGADGNPKPKPPVSNPPKGANENGPKIVKEALRTAKRFI